MCFDKIDDFARVEGTENTVALVMAAGGSRRFGTADKRRALLANGQSLLANSIAQISASFLHWRLVCRRDDVPERFGLSANTPVIYAPNASRGLGRSLADAAHAICEDASLASVDTAAIFLGDMPAIQRTTVRDLIKISDPTTIVRPTYQGRAGHPVIFGRDFWPELVFLDGDIGAKNLIHRFRSRCLELPVPDPGVIFDIDTAADIEQLIEQTSL